MPGIHDVHEVRTPRRVLPWVWVTLALVLGFFLLTGHRAHLFGALPYLLILLCPLMHLFMHHGHGGGHGHGHAAGTGLRADPNREAQP